MASPADPGAAREIVAVVREHGLRPTARLLHISPGTLARFVRHVERGDVRPHLAPATVERFGRLIEVYRADLGPELAAALAPVRRYPARGPFWNVFLSGQAGLARVSGATAADRSALGFYKVALRMVRDNEAGTVREALRELRRRKIILARIAADRYRLARAAPDGWYGGRTAAAWAERYREAVRKERIIRRLLATNGRITILDERNRPVAVRLDLAVDRVRTGGLDPDARELLAEEPLYVEEQLEAGGGGGMAA